MKKLFILLVGLLVGATPGLRASESMHLKELLAIGDLWESPRTGSPDVLLRRSFFAAEKALKGLPFKAVIQEFSRSRNTGTILSKTNIEFVLRNDVRYAAGGSSNELIIDVIRDANGGAICDSVILRNFPNGRRVDVAENYRGPAGNLVSHVLALHHLRQKAKAAEWIARIDTSFGKVVETGTDEYSYGFSVFVLLGKREGKKFGEGMRDVTYRALSGLDPIYSYYSTKPTVHPIGTLFRDRVLDGKKRAITSHGHAPAIFVSTESTR